MPLRNCSWQHALCLFLSERYRVIPLMSYSHGSPLSFFRFPVSIGPPSSSLSSFFFSFFTCHQNIPVNANRVVIFSPVHGESNVSDLFSRWQPDRMPIPSYFLSTNRYPSEMKARSESNAVNSTRNVRSRGILCNVQDC